MASEEALVVNDAREHELTRDLAAVNSGQVLAYAGVPLKLHGGFVIGTLSVADSKPRAWKPGDIEILHDLAASVLTEIEMRADIEARKQAEADLQRSTDRLRGLMDNSPTVIYAKDLEGRYLFLNHAGEQFLGLPEAEAIGKRDADLHPPELAAALCEHDEAVIAGGEPVEIEETIALGGSSTVYRSVKFPLTDEAGEPYGVCGISTDITERKQTERALRDAQQRLVSAFDHAPTGMAMVGTDGRFRQVNAALCELTGRTEAELLKLTLADTIHPEEWAARKRLVERMLTGEIRTHQTQGRFISGDGAPRWVFVNATALSNDDGWPAEFFVQFQDITEQTRSQQLLAARHDVTRVLAHGATVEQAAPLLLEALGANLGWQVGTLWLLDPRSDELQPAAKWSHRSFEGKLPPDATPLAPDDLPMRVTRSGEPVWTEALMAGAASMRATAIAATGLSGAVCLPIVTARRLPRRARVLLPRARRARRAAARAAGHDRHADRALHPAPARRRRARRRARRGARGRAAEVAVPGQHEPRDPHADERRDRDGRAAARHRAVRGAARLRLDGAQLRRRAAADHQRHPRPVEDRGRQARARARGVQPLRGGRHRRRHAGRERPRQGPRAARLHRAARAAARSSATASASSRSSPTSSPTRSSSPPRARSPCA